MKGYVMLVLCLSVVIGCKEEGVLLPKPRMYPKVTWPERIPVQLKNEECDFTFVFPSYFQYEKDRPIQGEDIVNDCWFNLTSKSLNSTLFFSYYPINKKADFDKYTNDAFEMAGKHNVKANSRRESTIEKEDVSGIIFEIDGPVATPLQFYMTDSTSHFLRASLYFNAKVNPDSTQVVYDFIKRDVEDLIGSFQWQ